jgi:ribosomal protein L29
VKRKRGAGRSSGDDDIREELKRLKAENQELRRQTEVQNAQVAEMMEQIRHLSQAVLPDSHPQMPAAHM